MALVFRVMVVGVLCALDLRGNVVCLSRVFMLPVCNKTILNNPHVIDSATDDHSKPYPSIVCMLVSLVKLSIDLFCQILVLFDVPHGFIRYGLMKVIIRCLCRPIHRIIVYHMRVSLIFSSQCFSAPNQDHITSGLFFIWLHLFLLNVHFKRIALTEPLRCSSFSSL